MPQRAKPKRITTKKKQQKQPDPTPEGNESSHDEAKEQARPHTHAKPRGPRNMKDALPSDAHSEVTTPCKTPNKKLKSSVRKPTPMPQRKQLKRVLTGKKQQKEPVPVPESSEPTDDQLGQQARPNGHTKPEIQHDAKEETASDSDPDADASDDSSDEDDVVSPANAKVKGKASSPHDDAVETAFASESEDTAEEAADRPTSGGESDTDESDSSDEDNESESESESDSESEETSSALDNQPDNEDTPSPVAEFSELTLDPRLERAIERAGWKKPTSVQASVMPIALHGRDVMVSAPTGSGKTAAYAIPLVQHVCRARSAASAGAAMRAVVFVPTRELVHQVTAVLKSLCRFVHGVHVAAIAPGTKQTARLKRMRAQGTGKVDEAAAMSAVYGSTDIVVGTPASVRALQADAENDPLRNVEFVVVDEADLVLSYGYEKDTRAALSSIPTSAQSMLLSATLESDGMESFRKIVLRRPLTVKVTSDAEVHSDGTVGASHYVSRLGGQKNRFLVMYAMLRLNVVCGKVLIFVNQINSAFRLKLFLDQFKVKSAVLNSELPANSRIHCVQQFNAGMFDILIAADESRATDSKDKENGKKGKAQSVSKKRKRVERDDEFGLSRGVDFKDVAAVVNFDVPETSESYTHRAGRTARGGASGTVLSLVCTEKEEESVVEMGKELGVHIGPLAFRMEQVEAFRYRVEDCLRMVTESAVQGARLADVRREMVNSEHLKGYFEDNPDDLHALQHNVRLATNVAEHLGHIPTYLMPAGLRHTLSKHGTTGRGKSRGKGRHVSAGNKKRADPLKGFSVSGSSNSRYREKYGIVKKKRNSEGSAVGRSKKRKFTHKKR